MGFKPIPGTPGWKISDEGVLIDPDGNIRKTYINGDGYVTAAIQTEIGDKLCWRTFGLHRLVAIAHIKCKGYPDEYHVNHRDLDKTNNVVGNLEWLTPREKNIHAALFSGSVERPAIVAWNLDEDDAFYIDTIKKAADLFKCSELEIWDIVRRGETVLGYNLEANVRGAYRPPSLNKPTFRERDVFGRAKQVPVLIKNLETGEVAGYESINDAAKFHEVSPSHIYQTISTPDKTKLFKRNYLIILDGDDFPNVSDEELETLRDPTGKEVWVYHKPSGQISIWPSASSFIKATNLSKKAVTVRLAKAKVEDVDGYVFTYKKDGGLDKLKEFMDSSQVYKF